MSVLHLVFTIKGGGAGIAAYRLHQSLKDNQYDSYIMTIDDDKNNLLKKDLFKYISIILCKLDMGSYWFPQSLGLLGQGLVNKINNHKAKIIHIHWINQGFLSIKDISKIKKPVVWTLHDEWFYSGCEHYETKEKLIYKTIINNEKILIPKLFKRFFIKIRYITNFLIKNYKLNCWRKKKFYIVSPSIWALNKLKSSKLYNLVQEETYIENSISEKLFKREIISSVPTKKVLYVSSQGLNDIRKGGFMIELLTPLIIKNGYELHIVGNYKKSKNLKKYKNKIIYHGKLDDEKLFTLMNESSILLHPSLIDNKPQVIIESLLAGCPVITYNSGGQKEIVKTLGEGICVNKYTLKEFEKAFIEIIRSNQNSLKSRIERIERAREKYNLNKSVEMHRNLYEKIDNV